jgi:hypothetical protein
MSDAPFSVISFRKYPMSIGPLVFVVAGHLPKRLVGFHNTANPLAARAAAL